MKNVTVSLEDELYRRSRVAAAESDTSVTALVREFLTEYTASGKSGADGHHASSQSDKVLEIIAKMRKRHPNFTADNLLTRDEIHSR
ncbi:MAG: hypothetical protein P1U86_05470 [Verrucomicrobiales bacterium]|nr:hypothetical protein [Verrucomicrobiales bacterium]